jgi:hemoglobin-like flavoprotein
MDEADTTAFLESLERVSAAPGFIDRFYDSFLGTSPEVAEIFAQTDMGKLKRKLKASLHVIALAAEGSPGSDLYLGYLGRVHRRFAIAPDLYDLWLESLVATAAGCDPQFDPQTAALWRRVVGRGIEAMRQAPDLEQDPEQGMGAEE